MFDAFSANIISATLPSMDYELPFLGMVNLNLFASAVIIFVGLNILFWLIRQILLGRLKALSKRTASDIDDVVVGAVQGIRSWVYTIVSIYAALHVFQLSDIVGKILTAVFLFAIVWQAIEIVTCFVTYFTKRFLSSEEDGSLDASSANASYVLTLFARIILWVLGGLFVLSNLGIEVVSLVAGLGIGGIAIAFALQGVLSDLFASFSIYMDKPFKAGDLITVGSDTGTVQKVGIKSTRIKTLRGEELVVSNTELTTARVQNFRHMEERRITSQFGVIYETSLGKLQEITKIVASIFENIEGVRLDRVHFTTLGDFSLNFEVVYFVESPDMPVYLDIQQQYNFELMRRFAELGIEFAYPTTVQYTKTV